MNNLVPYFLITIDTEGDNLWQKPDIISTDNAKYLSRFQKLAEKYYFKPTYLTNYEMAKSKEFVKFGKNVLLNNSGEIGMHLHAWSSPPHFELTKNDHHNMPFLIEYPEEVMYNKIEFITNLLENTFDTKMRSHRAGRWAFNETYAKIINQFGYLVDCSVTPHIILDKKCNYNGEFKTISYCGYPNTPYFVDLDNINKMDSSSSLLEIPLSIIIDDETILSYLRRFFSEESILNSILNHITSNPLILRPDGNNLIKMKKILNNATICNWPCVELMLHSSELMPGGSPYFPHEEDIEKLYRDIEDIFETAQGSFQGETCSGFYSIFVSQ